jgi:hypothetical protein
MKKIFFVASLKSVKKGVGSGSGSISQRYGSGSAPTGDLTSGNSSPPVIDVPWFGSNSYLSEHSKEKIILKYYRTK